MSSTARRFTCFSPRCLDAQSFKSSRRTFTNSTSPQSVIAPRSNAKVVANSHSASQTTRPTLPIPERAPIPIPIPGSILPSAPLKTQPQPNSTKVVGARQGPTVQRRLQRDNMQAELERQAQGGPRRFRPLNPVEAEKDTQKGKELLRGIVFDVDGTLCLPQTPMFAAMRNAAAIPPGKDILHHISSLPSPERENAMAAIKAVESEYMLLQTPQPGLVELMSYLTSRGVRKGLLTRNFEDPVRHLISKFLSDEAVGTFEPVVTRAFEPPKPRPEGMWWIAREWGLDLEPPPDLPMLKSVDYNKAPGLDAEVGKRTTQDAFEGVGQAVADDAEAQGKTVDQRQLGRGLIMVGDSLDDMTAGHTAGAATVLLLNDVNRHLKDHEHTDFSIERLDELIDVLEHGFVGHRHR